MDSYHIFLSYNSKKQTSSFSINLHLIWSKMKPNPSIFYSPRKAPEYFKNILIFFRWSMCEICADLLSFFIIIHLIEYHVKNSLYYKLYHLIQNASYILRYMFITGFDRLYVSLKYHQHNFQKCIYWKDGSRKD